jgi:predicted patatin/cPLA2 family phospholipase
MQFTHPPIIGRPHKTILPEKTALVLEGGGTRGFYTAGVFEAFMDAGIMFPYIAGVSAGAANALTYIAGQPGRNRQIVEHYVGNHRYVSRRNMLRHGSLFGYDFIFKTVPQNHIFFDSEMFENVDIRYLTGAIDCNTGKTVWFEKHDINPAAGFTATRASCSVPLMSKIVRHNGYELLDGGVSSPIPIEKSLSDSNEFHVIVLTRNEGYQKAAFRHKSVLNLFYRKYPNLVTAIMNRHHVYNRSLQMCEDLQKAGKAIIIRPLVPLAVDRSGTDINKLLALYHEGHEEGRQALRPISVR